MCGVTRITSWPTYYMSRDSGALGNWMHAQQMTLQLEVIRTITLFSLG